MKHDETRISLRGNFRLGAREGRPLSVPEQNMSKDRVYYNQFHTSKDHALLMLRRLRAHEALLVGYDDSERYLFIILVKFGRFQRQFSHYNTIKCIVISLSLHIRERSQLCITHSVLEVIS